MNRWLVIGTFVLGMSAGALHCGPQNATAQEAGNDAGSAAPNAPLSDERLAPHVNRHRYVEGWDEVQGIKGGGVISLKIPEDARMMQVNLSVIDKRALPVAAVVVLKDDIGHILKQIDPNVQTAFIPISAGATVVNIDNLSELDEKDFHTSYYRAQVTFDMVGE